MGSQESHTTRWLKNNNNTHISESLWCTKCYQKLTQHCNQLYFIKEKKAISFGVKETYGCIYPDGLLYALFKEKNKFSECAWRTEHSLWTHLCRLKSLTFIIALFWKPVFLWSADTRLIRTLCDIAFSKFFLKLSFKLIMKNMCLVLKAQKSSIIPPSQSNHC